MSSAIDILQVFTFLLCLATVVVWLLSSRNDGNLVYVRWLIIIPSVITVVFYTAVLLTDFNENDPVLTALISAMIRSYTQAVFLFAGIGVLVAANRRGIK